MDEENFQLNVKAHGPPVFPGLFTPVLGLIIPVVREANLTGSQVEQGLGVYIMHWLEPISCCFE